MASYLRLIKGTSVVWAPSGGDKVLTLTSLANNAAREGDKSASLIHGTYGLPAFLDVFFETAVAVAATTGNVVELRFGESDSATAGTDNPGNLTGADAGWSNPDELKAQLWLVGALSLSNTRGTNVQAARFRFVPLCAYIIPAVVNLSGQALSATAGNHSLTAIPYYLETS